MLSIRILNITISNKINNRDSKIDDIEAVEADTEREDDLRDTAENDENKITQEEADDKREVNLERLKKELDEIRSNMAVNNGRLDDTILNK